MMIATSKDTTEPEASETSVDARAAGEVAESKAQQDTRGSRFDEVLCEAIAEMRAKGMAYEHV